MKKQTIIKLEDGKSIPCYVQKSQLRLRSEQSDSREGNDSYYYRKTINGKRRLISAEADLGKDEAHIEINQKVHKLVCGQKVKSKRSAAPTLTEVARAYLAATPSCVTACQGTRKTNLYSLTVVTRGMASGGDPVIEKQKDGSYKLVDGGFWDNVRLDKLDKKIGKAFLDSRLLGYPEKTQEWYERASGANTYLRQARGVFSQAALTEVYEENFIMPDLEDKKTGFLKVRFLPQRKKKWKAPKKSVIDQIFEKVPALEAEDPDIYACFLLQFGCGLSWGEVRHAQNSWLGEAETPNTDGTTRYVIGVKPVGDWVPKCEDRERFATVPENIFQKLLDLRFAPRAPREDRKSPVNISDEDLAKRVWSEPATQVAKSFKVTSTTIANQCRKRGIPTPPAGFWTKVDRGLVDNPKGKMPKEEHIRFLIRAQKPEAPKDDFILQRHRCEGRTAANSRLARWFRENIVGWDRKQVGHELRKLNISRVICATGSMYEGSKHAGHSSIKVTETNYGDLLENKRVEIPFPGT
jgi:hypothetical protein